MLAIPAFALSSAAASGRFGSVMTPEATAIAPADDPLVNGFRIVEPAPAGAGDSARAVSVSNEPVEKLLQEWNFTGRGRPSPGH
jgi:hypothetical protein